MNHRLVENLRHTKKVNDFVCLYALANYGPATIAKIWLRTNVPKMRQVYQILKKMEGRGWVLHAGRNCWLATEAGRSAIRKRREQYVQLLAYERKR